MIYIIDDDLNVREGFMMLLKSAGYESQTYDSAENFLKNYQKREINDLIILDIHLTGMSGIELLEKMDAEKIHLPVVVITAYDDQVTRIAVRNYGALAYFRKPVDSEALIDVIKYNLNSNINQNIN